jgi:hypothetical protein
MTVGRLRREMSHREFLGWVKRLKEMRRQESQAESGTAISATSEVETKKQLSAEEAGAAAVARWRKRLGAKGGS